MAGFFCVQLTFLCSEWSVRLLHEVPQTFLILKQKKHIVNTKYKRHSTCHTISWQKAMQIWYRDTFLSIFYANELLFMISFGIWTFGKFGFQYSDKRQPYIRIFMKKLNITYLQIYHWEFSFAKVILDVLLQLAGLYLHLLKDSLLLLVILGLEYGKTWDIRQETC
jgi:hypothetical protein